MAMHATSSSVFAKIMFSIDPPNFIACLFHPRIIWPSMLHRQGSVLILCFLLTHQISHDSELGPFLVLHCLSISSENCMAMYAISSWTRPKITFLLTHLISHDFELNLFLAFALLLRLTQELYGQARFIVMDPS